jgi:hypothetical protein
MQLFGTFYSNGSNAVQLEPCEHSFLPLLYHNIFRYLCSFSAPQPKRGTTFSEAYPSVLPISFQAKMLLFVMKEPLLGVICENSL